jgi:FMN-dependent NADH-azoreductase
MQLLHIDSSINGNNSASRKLTAQIVDAWKAKHADTQVSYLDLVARPGNHFTSAAMAPAPASPKVRAPSK